MLEVTVKAPALPTVPERSCRLESPLLVTTEAVTPMLDALMAPASPDRLLLGEVAALGGTLTVWAAPLPTRRVRVPASASAALAIPVMVPVSAVLLVFPPVSEYPRVGSVVATMLELTLTAPLFPAF